MKTACSHCTKMCIKLAACWEGGRSETFWSRPVKKASAPAHWGTVIFQLKNPQTEEGTENNTVVVCLLRERKILFTWSVHQHQIATTVRPNIRPGQGRSPVMGSLSTLKESARGRWQVVFGTVTFGIAVIYFSWSPSYQPTFSNPVKKMLVV